MEKEFKYGGWTEKEWKAWSDKNPIGREKHYREALGYINYCKVHEKFIDIYGVDRLDERAYKFFLGGVGGEIDSVVDLIIDHELPKLEKLDPNNKLLELKLTRDHPYSSAFHYSPQFGKVFGGVPLNVSLQLYERLLDMEIGNLENTYQLV